MEPFIGEIGLFAFNFVPNGWHACDGSLLQISTYSALYALLGTTYGGDGHMSFALPDLRNASPIPGMTYCIALQGNYPPRPF
ncbi:MAG: tail fiber protein [Acidobacteria bacterium]|nr:MAG: tail fiber protein [Acidobacteriota bacterium]